MANYSRRDFLKVLGAGSGAALGGCGERLPEKIIPYVVQPDEVIPGRAVWYTGSCNECGAGCGTLVRVREGRAVKVEGNPSHPINSGGLCARGQSGLQDLYDPDRVREPLQREPSGAFGSISWVDATARLAEAVKNRATDEVVVLITRPLTGSLKQLVGELTRRVPQLEHYECDLSGYDAHDDAAARSFGREIHYDLSAADLIVSFGADYLSDWRSPVELARQWAERRRGEGKRSYTVHVEPRLSLTAANADRWVKPVPGSEGALLAALLKLVLEHSGERGLPPEFLSDVRKLVSSVDVAAVSELGGLEQGVLQEIAARLIRAETSAVLVGGAALSVPFPIETALLGNLLNAVLGNLGRSVILGEAATEQQRYQKLYSLLTEMRDGKRKVALALLADTNLLYARPELARAALAKAGFVATVSMRLDETADFAQLVLPLSTSFESWGDSVPRRGVYNLNQPAMQPLYKTQSLGDTLLALLAKLEIRLEGVSTFYDYLRAQWRKRLGVGVGTEEFEVRWLTCLQEGGEFTAPTPEAVMFEQGSTVVGLAPLLRYRHTPVTVVAYAGPSAADGSSAYRPWMQELPDPLTKVVWGSWIEIHPTRAERFGLKEGDVAQVAIGRNAIEAPVLITNDIHPDLIAVGLGKGHETGGRYAAGIGVNAWSVLPVEPVQGQIRLAAHLELGEAAVRRSFAHEELVRTQKHASQEGRGLVRTISEGSVLAAVVPDAHLEGERYLEPHGGKRPQMYRPLEPPLYRWGMTIDLAACTGCSACVVACYAENNIPVVGKEICAQGREMAWLRIERYVDEESKDRPSTGFLPMLCQHCSNAPCEPVCPVYATYHNEEGLNSMVYNRCVGTRYCSNNCSYKVRRFNFFGYHWPEPLNWQLNPDVTLRASGVMEKCTFCVQRIAAAKNSAKNEGRLVRDGEIQPACASSCPTKAITFGNLNDPETSVSKMSRDRRAYQVLDEHLNTQPAISYLARITADDH